MWPNLIMTIMMWHDLSKAKLIWLSNTNMFCTIALDILWLAVKKKSVQQVLTPSCAHLNAKSPAVVSATDSFCMLVSGTLYIRASSGDRRGPPTKGTVTSLASGCWRGVQDAQRTFTVRVCARTKL